MTNEELLTQLSEAIENDEIIIDATYDPRKIAFIISLKDLESNVSISFAINAY